MKNVCIFYLKIFFALVIKFSVYLNRHVFVIQEFLAEKCPLELSVNKSNMRSIFNNLPKPTKNEIIYLQFLEPHLASIQQQSSLTVYYQSLYPDTPDNFL